MRISAKQNVQKTSIILFGQLLRKFLAIAICVLTSLVFTQSLHAQNTIRVKGRVLNESGQPVPKATVLVRGNTSSGVNSDDEGNFEIVVPSNATLNISSVNYVTMSVRIAGRPTLEIVLAPSASSNLDQVVVVGYGTQKKRDVTGSVVSVGEQALRSVPVSNLQGALQGKAAGLEVQTVGTTPGSSAQIRIRGIKSIFGSNDPLIILDGIPYDGTLNDINPDDVASVEILKDASATAIYGSRGANGILLVTSKRGRPGESKVSFSGYYGIGTVFAKYPVFNAQEYQAMRNISPWSVGYQPLELKSIANGSSTDWQKLMYQNSLKTNDNITVYGGNNGSSYSLGGGYYKETALLPGQDFTRYSLKATIDNRIGRKVKVGLNTLNTVTITHGSQFVSPMFPILALSPLMPADTSGKLLKNPDGDNDDLSTQYSPLLLKSNNNQWADKVRHLHTFNSLYGEYEFIPGLKYRANLGLSYYSEEDDQFQASDDPNTPSYFRPNQGNTAYVNNAEQWGYTMENLVTYDKVIKKSRISFTGLYSIQESHMHNTSVSKDSITANFVQFYDLALATPTHPPVVNGAESSNVILSYMGRVNYSYDNKYMLTLTARDDGSSHLAIDHKWHQYAAASLGWNIADEGFMKHISWTSALKIRASYGETSNQSIPAYGSLGLVNNSNGVASPANTIRYNFGTSQIVTGLNVVTLPNTTLDWEYTKTLDLGLDFGFLRNRITGSLDYYNAKTNKILYNVTLPVTSGVAGSYLTNVGNMSNWGMEFSVNTINIESHRKSGFSWSTDFNLFFNRNKLLSLSGGISMDVGNQLFVGHSMTAIYDYKKLGIWQTKDAALAATFGQLPGQLRIADLSGPTGKPDGTISSPYDQTVIGDQDAKLQGGMTNHFYFKHFDLSVVAYARFGGLLVSQVHQPFASYLTVMDGKRNGLKVDYWTPTNPTDWFPEPSASTVPPNASTAWTTLGYYSATFVKLRSMNLGYTLDNTMLRKLNASTLRVYFTIDNLATLFSPFKNQTGIDPEATAQGNTGVSNPGNIRSNTTTNGNGALTVGLTTPQTRNFIVGINLTF